jgi:ATP-binding cassette, subfamily G (WHITE), member 2, SNQ2
LLTILVVLGSPGSGCTTLLKALTNQRSEYLAVNGNVFYDSLSPHEIESHFRGDVQYCAEDDIHFPTLTVQQTLDFAAKTRTPQKRSRVEQVSRKEFHEVVTDIVTTVFGLRHARGTVVGDAAIRGISGGEKKRVSIAESLSTRAAIGAWDKYVASRTFVVLMLSIGLHSSTRGLDSSTALEFVKALRIATDTFNVTTIVSLYQAGESLYEHFDKVCVLNEGRMAYFGPSSKAKEYFMDMGYVICLLYFHLINPHLISASNPRIVKLLPTSSLQSLIL